MNIRDIENDPSSDVQLECIKDYDGSYQVGPGQFKYFQYKKGTVLPRKRIFLRSNHWKIYTN
jgi:hypothetical protein